jgi:hypothetical protein
MKKWSNFIITPLLAWIVLTLSLIIVKFLIPESNFVTRAFEVFIFIGFALLPYLMLSLTTNYRYFFTMIYMMILVIVTSLMQANFNIHQINYDYIALGLSWTLIALTIYYFYSEH